MTYDVGDETILVMTEVYYDEYGEPKFYASSGDGLPAPAILHTSYDSGQHDYAARDELMDTIDKFIEAMKKPVLRISDFKKVP